MISRALERAHPTTDPSHSFALARRREALATARVAAAQLHPRIEALEQTLMAIAIWPDSDHREPANSMARVARRALGDDFTHIWDGQGYG